MIKIFFNNMVEKEIIKVRLIKFVNTLKVGYKLKIIKEEHCPDVIFNLTYLIWKVLKYEDLSKMWKTIILETFPEFKEKFIILWNNRDNNE